MTDTDLRPCTVYRLFDADGALLYVGVAVEVERRLMQHHRKFWWSQVADVKTAEYRSRSEAEAAERAAIQAETPRHNISHSTVNQPRYNRGGIGGDLMSKDAVAVHLNIQPESVRSTLRRYGITEQRGYSRTEVLAIERAGQGSRTDLVVDGRQRRRPQAADTDSEDNR